jgi:hypothetical protein
MPRYYFHLVSPPYAVRDAQGVELKGLHAAYWHAKHLIYRLRVHEIDEDSDWMVEVCDDDGAIRLVALPRCVAMLHERKQGQRLQLE